VSDIQLVVLCALVYLSIHMFIIVLRQYREIKEAKNLLEIVQQRILEHIEERKEWRKEKDKMRHELDKLRRK